MIKLSRRFQKRASLGIVLASGAAFAGLIAYDAWGKRQVMGVAMQGAEDCIRSAGLDAETKMGKSFDPFSLSLNYHLESEFSRRRGEGEEPSYQGQAFIKTGIDPQKGRPKRSDAYYKEEQIETLDSGFRTMIAGFPTNDGKYCVRLPEDELIPCLLDHGWYFDEEEPGSLKSLKITQDKDGMSKPDMLRVIFTVEGQAISSAQVTTNRPAYPFYGYEFNKNGATLDPALKQTGDAIGACHAQALEAVYGPTQN